MACEKKQRGWFEAMTPETRIDVGYPIMTTAAKHNFNRAGLTLWLGGFCVAASALLAACSGGGGGGETANPAPPTVGGTSGGFVYGGPAANSPDVVRFQQNFYNNLVA